MSSRRDIIDWDLLADSLAELADHATSHPLEHFRPTVPQLSFMCDLSRIKLFRGPNQAGKTVVGAVESVHRLKGTHPALGDLGEQHGWVICHSWKQSIVIQNKVREFVSPDEWADTVTHTTKNGFSGAYLELKNGNSLRFLTAGQGTVALASGTVDFVWIDEPPPEQIWGELLSRVRNRERPGVPAIYLTLTPYGAPVEWLREKVEAGEISETHATLTPETCTPIGGVPFMSHEQITRYANSLLRFERDQRVEAAWEGRIDESILDSFTESCLSDRPPVPASGAKINVAVGIDHGAKANRQVASLVLWWEDGNDLRVHLWDEQASGDRTTSQDDARGILDMLARNNIDPFDVDVMVGDRNHNGDKHGNRKSNRDLSIAFADCLTSGSTKYLPRPLRQIRSPKKYAGSVVYGFELLNDLLATGRMLVHPRCGMFVSGCNSWDGDKNSPLKDPLDSARYPIEVIHEQHSRRRIGGYSGRPTRP